MKPSTFRRIFNKWRDKKEGGGWEAGAGSCFERLGIKGNGNHAFGTHTSFVRCWDNVYTNLQILHHVQARKLLTNPFFCFVVFISHAK